MPGSLYPDEKSFLPTPRTPSSCTEDPCGSHRPKLLSNPQQAVGLPRPTSLSPSLPGLIANPPNDTQGFRLGTPPCHWLAQADTAVVLKAKVLRRGVLDGQ